MKSGLTLILVFAAVCLTAQTRRIAHRFHSGDNTERYDNHAGNYGATYPMNSRSPVRLVDSIVPVQRVKSTVVPLVDVSFVQTDTINLQQSSSPQKMTDVRDYGKICSSYSGK